MSNGGSGDCSSMSVESISWVPLPSPKGATQSVPARFVIRRRTLGGMELVDSKTGRRYPAYRAAELRTKALKILTAEATDNGGLADGQAQDRRSDRDERADQS